MTGYEWVEDTTSFASTIQPDSILSRTLYKNSHAKAVLFSFDAGQSLSEHQASQPAILYILQGEATVRVGDDEREARAGTLIDMEAKLTHSVYARTPLVMLLFLLQIKADGS